MFRSRVLGAGRAIALVTILAGAGLACEAAISATNPRHDAVATPASQAIKHASDGSDVAGLIANARAARRQGDWHSLRRFQADLMDRLGLRAISDARADYRRALADFAAADAAGDAHSRAEFRVQLRALCGPGGLVGAFEPCDAAIGASGA